MQRTTVCLTAVLITGGVYEAWKTVASREERDRIFLDWYFPTLDRLQAEWEREPHDD